MTPAPRLEVEDLTRYFGSFPALDGVSFAVDSGGFLVILGPNGAGKTTLVKILARLSRPSSGRILLNREEWLEAPAERQSDLGVLSHATYLYDGLTAVENLRFFAVLYDLSDPDARAREALATVDLGDKADNITGTLSRGQAQRLSIARAVLHDPGLLLLDEPYAGLDPLAAGRLSDVLTRLCAEGRTIIMTTHDLARIPAAATDYLVLVSGRVRICGSRETLTPEELERVYAGAVAAEEGESGP